MIITHASAEKITEVTPKNYYAPFLKGCLCFASKGNEYNLAGKCTFQYSLDVSNIINVGAFFIYHDISEKIVKEVIDLVRDNIETDAPDEEIAELLSNESSVRDFEFTGYDDAGEAEWAIQQYQGILAHKLGYDCAQSVDEQGTVYIAYCVGRLLLEVQCASRD